MKPTVNQDWTSERARPGIGVDSGIFSSRSLFPASLLCICVFFLPTGLCLLVRHGGTALALEFIVLKKDQANSKFLGRKLVGPDWDVVPTPGTE